MSISSILGRKEFDGFPVKPLHLERTKPQGFSERSHRAPFETPLRVTFNDAQGETELPFDCIRTNDGWRNFNTRARLAITVTGWKPA